MFSGGSTAELGRGGATTAPTFWLAAIVLVMLVDAAPAEAAAGSDGTRSAGAVRDVRENQERQENEEAQETRERRIVSNQIAVSSGEATLRIEFVDDEPLEVSFSDGTVTIDGREIGSYVPGDALETSWRSLLGQAVSLNGGSLSELLSDWEPPEDAPEEVAGIVDSELERRLATPSPSDTVMQDVPQDPSAGASPGLREFDGALLERLLGRTERIRELQAVVEDLAFNGVRVHAGESVTIDADEEVRGTLLVVDGDVELYGRVDGNIVLLGGTLNLHDGSHVTGDVRWSDGRVVGDRDVVEGRIRRIEPAAAPAAPPAREQVRDTPRQRRSVLSPLRHIGRGIAGLFQNLISFAILAVIGFGIFHFAGDKLEVVARTARRSAARSAAVGFAGAFLFVPVWILGMVALAISIIGIPALLAWIPLFPLAVGLAILFGYVAVSLTIGEWVAAQRFEKLRWLRVSNPFMALLAGFAVLLVPFVAANLIQMGGPWLGALHGLLTALGVIAGLIVLTVGFGAVLLSRGGRNPDFAWIDFEPGSGPDEPDDWGEPAPRAPGPGPGPATGPSSAAAPEAASGGATEVPRKRRPSTAGSESEGGDAGRAGSTKRPRGEATAPEGAEDDAADVTPARDSERTSPGKKEKGQDV